MSGYNLFRAAGVSLPVALMAAIAMSIGGCTGASLNQYDQNIETDRMDAKTACHQARSTGETARMQAVSNLPKEQQALMLAMEAMRGQAEALSGKDPCGTGMNAHEARVAIAKSQNETIGAIAPVVASGATVYGVVNSTTRAINTMAGKAGNQTTTTVTGDNNSASHVNTQTTANTQNEVSADGEGSSPSVSNGSVTGPDQSSTSETIHEAPAAPVVAE